jgi:hypothetical protein
MNNLQIVCNHCNTFHKIYMKCNSGTVWIEPCKGCKDYDKQKNLVKKKVEPFVNNCCYCGKDPDALENYCECRDYSDMEV